jgi:periplasmic protein CpxP/Spy
MSFSTLRSRLPSMPGSRLAATALLVAVLGSVTLSAWAMPHGGGHAGHGGPGMGMMFGGRGLERMLDGVNATADQRTQIKAIAERARADLQTQREASKGTREQFMTLFTQPTVDAAAAEALRAQTMQQHDQASRRVMQAMIEISRVLTPEQRKQLADRMQQRRAMMERHMNERRSLDGSTTR